jgi:hypothetical protein
MLTLGLSADGVHRLVVLGDRGIALQEGRVPFAIEPVPISTSHKAAEFLSSRRTLPFDFHRQQAAEKGSGFG